MRYIKKPKYKLDRKKVIAKPKRDLTPEELYKELLRSKIRKRR